MSLFLAFSSFRNVCSLDLERLSNKILCRISCPPLNHPAVFIKVRVPAICDKHRQSATGDERQEAAAEMVTSLDRLSEGASILIGSSFVGRFSDVLGVRPEDLPVSNVALHAYFFTVTCAYCFLVKNTTRRTECCVRFVWNAACCVAGYGLLRALCIQCCARCEPNAACALHQILHALCAVCVCCVRQAVTDFEGTGYTVSWFGMATKSSLKSWQDLGLDQEGAPQPNIRPTS